MRVSRARAYIAAAIVLIALCAAFIMMPQGAYAQEGDADPGDTVTDPADPTNPTGPSDPTEPTGPGQETPPDQENPVKTGWVEDENGFHYYDQDGKLLKGVQLIEGDLYYFSAKYGTKRTNFFASYEGKQYYFGANGIGVKYTGIRGDYFYAKGVKQTKYIKTLKKMTDGKTYYFKKNGTVQKSSKAGLRKVDNGKTYYFNGANQVITGSKTGFNKINGKLYYVQKDKAIYRGNGWKRISGSRYYFKDSAAVTGWKYIGSYKYYFSTNGRLAQDLIARFGSSWMKRDLTIRVNRTQNCVTIYARDGSKGYTIPVKAITCSVGKANTPTIRGNFKIDKARTYRWHKLGSPAMGGYSYGQYCSRIQGSYLFHSVTYAKPNNRTLNTANYNNLGRAASHGCIRLQTKDAKLIYQIARYRTTKVNIYDGKSVGPFDKPTIRKIPSNQKYDPTDVTVK